MMAQSTKCFCALAMMFAMVFCSPLSAAPDFDASSLSLDDDVKAVQERFQKQMEDMRGEFSRQLELRNQEFEKRISQIREVAAKELENTKTEARAQFEMMKQRAAEELESFGQQVEEQLSQLKSLADDKLTEAQAEIERLIRENENLKKMLRELGGISNEVGSDGQNSGAGNSRPRARLGISVLPGDEEAATWVRLPSSRLSVVASVTPGGAGDMLGLKVGDVITEVDGKEASIETLQSVAGSKKVGDEITFIWARRGTDGVLRTQVKGVLAGEGVQGEIVRDRVRRNEGRRENVSPRREQRRAPVAERAVPGVSLGVSVIQEDDFGVRVTELDAGSNAAIMGLIVGDVVTGVGDARIRTIDGLRDILSRTMPGAAVELHFQRDGRAWIAKGMLAQASGDGATRTSLERASTVRGFLGIVPAESEGGLVVQEVIEGSCAAQMGLRSGDRLVSVGGKTIPDLDSLRASLGDLRAGDSLKIGFSRDGEALERRGVLGAYPETEDQSAAPDQSAPGRSAPGRSALNVIPARELAKSPSSTAAPMVTTRSAVTERLQQQRPVRKPNEPALGIAVVWSEAGVNVERVFPGSLAEEAGLEMGDRLIRIENTAIDSIDAIRAALADREEFGVVFEVERGLDTVVLMTRPREAVVAFEDSVKLTPTSAVSTPASVTPVAALSSEEPPFLGMDVEENSWGIMVVGTLEGLPAHNGGLRPGDWVISICETSVETIEDMQTALQYQGLHSISMKIRRGIETIEVTIPLLKQ